MKNTFIPLLILFSVLNAQTLKNSITTSKALEMVQSESPTFKPTAPKKMIPKEISDLGFEQVYTYSTRKFIARDGKSLHANLYERQSNIITILLHGILSSSYTMNKSAGLLREAMNSEIISLDLRGHGQSEGEPGDVNYINQYSYDLDDIVKTVKKENPTHKVVIAGHSMGAGISLLFSMLDDRAKVDGFVFLAPHLGHNVPSIEKNSTNKPNELSFMKIHINRIIGLEALNAEGIHKYNSLPVLFFNLPKSFPITQYSYRANKSAAPADYLEGLKSVTVPLIVLIGSKDEAFDSTKIKSIVKDHSQGEVSVIDGETHGGIRHNHAVMLKISNWTKRNIVID